MSNATRPLDALIVGAGPVGLTMASALLQEGLACRIIDKAPAPSDKSKALVVWSRTLELLDNCRLADRFVQTGLKIRGASIYDANQRLVHVLIEDAESRFGFPLMIPQNDTERLLTEDLASQAVLIERPVELASFAEQGDHVIATLRHADGRSETIEVPWLLGCDGAHSTVRHALGVPFTGCAEPNDWLLADVHVTGPLPSDEISIYWHEKGILIFFPIGQQRFRVIADIGIAQTERPADPTLAEVQAKVDERGPTGLKLHDPIWLAGFRINERKVSDYRRGRVFLSGDAAHIHSPAGGQGMNTGMQDAFNLAWKLALVHRGQGRAEVLLDSYSTERSAVGDQVLSAASRLTAVATLRNPVSQFLRNHVASLIGSFSFVQEKFRNELRELSINYRHGPLTAEDWSGHPAVHSGDRLPDMPLVSLADGAESCLHLVVRGAKHALLLLPGAAASDELAKIAAGMARRYGGLIESYFVLPAGSGKAAFSSTGAAWIDSTGKLYEQLGVRQPALVLVRPDGYIGYRAQPATAALLQKYLDRYLIARC